MSIGGVPGKHMHSSATKGSFLVTILEVVGDNPGGGIDTTLGKSTVICKCHTHGCVPPTPRQRSAGGGEERRKCRLELERIRRAGGVRRWR